MTDPGPVVAQPSQAWKVLVVVGLAAIVLGIFLGFLPIKSDGSSCGSAFAKSNDALSDDLFDSMVGGDGGHQDDCASARSARLPIALGAIVIGAALTIGGFVVKPKAG